MRHVRRRSERGDATVETVLAVPVLLFVILVVIQAGLWFHGSQVMEAGAQEGLRAGRVEGATVGDAETRARQFVSGISPSLGATTTIEASRTAEVTRVVVTGRVQEVVPGVRLSVSGTAQGPTERFREDR